jgi:glutathione synthase/RimK-type ligase-like ATP-grasp enzyme
MTRSVGADLGALTGGRGARGRRVAFAACGRFPDLHDDWPLQRAALEELGVEARTQVWDDPAVDWSAYDLLVVNGTWDNIHRVDEFLSWTERVTGAGVAMVNSPATLRWNIDKRYLRDLERDGVPTVPTLWVEPGPAAPDPAGLEFPEGEVVVKPAISGGGFLTARYGPDEHAVARRHIADLVEGGRTAMVQRYQPSVDVVGETGLIFLGGAFSHAMHKDPMIRPGVGATQSLIDNQVVTAATAEPAQLAVAAHALAAAERRLGPTAYARVDLVERTDGQPALLELELLDPVLFFITHPAGAGRFARVLVAALTG